MSEETAKTGMSGNGLARHGIRILCALFVVLGAVVSVSVGTQHTAQAASCAAYESRGYWHVPFNCSGVRIPAAHH